MSHLALLSTDSKCLTRHIVVYIGEVLANMSQAVVDDLGCLALLVAFCKPLVCSPCSEG